MFYARARLLTCLCAIIVGVLRRVAETVIFPCKMANEYCGDLLRRRIHAKTAQTNCQNSWKSLVSASRHARPLNTYKLACITRRRERGRSSLTRVGLAHGRKLYFESLSCIHSVVFIAVRMLLGMRDERAQAHMRAWHIEMAAPVHTVFCMFASAALWRCAARCHQEPDLWPPAEITPVHKARCSFTVAPSEPWLSAIIEGTSVPWKFY